MYVVSRELASVETATVVVMTSHASPVVSNDLWLGVGQIAARAYSVRLSLLQVLMSNLHCRTDATKLSSSRDRCVGGVSGA